jgi:hypothetical protein
MDTITPDAIRQKALMKLAKSEMGIRQADLFKEVELELSYEFVIPDHAVKNALWDLPEKFPEYVVKTKLSYRNVILYPTKQLIDVIDKTFIETQTYDSRVLEAPVIDMRKTRNTMLAYKVMEIHRFIEESEIFPLIIEIQQNYLKDMTISEIEALFGIKNSLDQLRQYRNQYVHMHNLRK